MTIKGAVEKELAELRKIDPQLADSALAASALRLAVAMDDLEVAPAELASCARALLVTVNRLLELKPRAVQEGSRLDELSARRSARISDRQRRTS